LQVRCRDGVGLESKVEQVQSALLAESDARFGDDADFVSW
jgi:hypothetical protein